MASYQPALSQAQMDELKQTAESIVHPGKGILAADESTGIISRIQFGTYSLTLPFQEQWANA